MVKIEVLEIPPQKNSPQNYFGKIKSFMFIKQTPMPNFSSISRSQLKKCDWNLFLAVKCDCKFQHEGTPKIDFQDDICSSFCSKYHQKTLQHAHSLFRSVTRSLTCTIRPVLPCTHVTKKPLAAGFCKNLLKISKKVAHSVEIPAPWQLGSGPGKQKKNLSHVTGKSLAAGF